MLDLLEVVHGYQKRVGKKPGCSLTGLARLLKVSGKDKEKLQKTLDALVQEGKLVFRDGRYWSDTVKFKTVKLTMPEESFVRLMKIHKENEGVTFGTIFHCLLETYGKFPINLRVAPWVR